MKWVICAGIAAAVAIGIAVASRLWGQTYPTAATRLRPILIEWAGNIMLVAIGTALQHLIDHGANGSVLFSLAFAAVYWVWARWFAFKPGAYFSLVRSP
jgi:hypothetical protein